MAAGFNNLLYMQLPVGVLLLKGANYIVVRANQKQLLMMGKQGHEIIGKPLLDIFPELTEQGFREKLDKVYKEGTSCIVNEHPHITGSDSSVHYYSYSINPLTDRKGQHEYIICVTNEVTEIVVSRNKFNENYEKYHGLLNTMKQGFCIIQMIFKDGRPHDYRFLETNPAFVNQTGLVDAVGKTMKELAPDHENHWFEIYGKVALTGEEITFDAGAAMLDRWYDVHAFRVGMPEEMKVAVLFSDISEKRRAEQDMQNFASELQFQVSARTRELERSNYDLLQFAHVASHDMKEPVRKIITFISFIRDELKSKLDYQVDYYLTRINRAALRLEQMINGILNYSKAGDIYVMGDTDLNKLINDIKFDLELLINEKNAVIEITPLPIINGSATLLYQLFYNLIYNSLKFASPARPCIIRVTASSTEIAGKGFVNITITDNGIGFKPEMNEQVFNKFARLHSKDKYEGTGLGLALCRKIVNRHSGFITASGEPDKGATFTVLLPSAGLS